MKNIEYIAILEPVVDLYVGKVSDEVLSLLGFNPNDSGGWIGHDFNGEDLKNQAKNICNRKLSNEELKLLKLTPEQVKVDYVAKSIKELFENLTEKFNNGKNSESVLPGGSFLNSARLVGQLGGKPTIVIPYKLTKEDYKNEMFDEGFGEHVLIELSSEIPEKQVRKLTVFVFVNNKGQRFLISVNNGKMKFPTLSKNEWNSKLNLTEKTRIGIEGFPFYANKESLSNLIELAYEKEIPVDFCLSNDFKLKNDFSFNKGNPESIFKFLKEGKISHLIGNEEEFHQLIKSNKNDELLIEFKKELSEISDLKDKINDLENKFSHLKNEFDEKQTKLFFNIFKKFEKTTFFITQGKYDTLIIDSRFNNLKKIPVIRLGDPSRIKDTNGAGDAFAGGLIKFFCNKKVDNFNKFSNEDLANAVNFAHKCASEIIQIDGANLRGTETVLKKLIKKQESNFGRYY